MTGSNKENNKMSKIPNLPTAGRRRRPCVQIVRGLPGAGKSTLARKFDCLHLELDQRVTSGRTYRWSPKANAVAKQWLSDNVLLEMRNGIDLVVCGVMPRHDGTMGEIFANAFDAGYEVFVKTLGEHPFRESVHDVRPCDMARFRKLMMTDDEVRESVLADDTAYSAKFRRWFRAHVHFDSVMPFESEVRNG